jgi:hypothetical protein
MNAIREIVKPVNNKIVIDIPVEFQNNKEFEVIILPSEEKKIKKSRKDLFGRYKGQIRISEDFNEPLDDFKEYMD